MGDDEARIIGAAREDDPARGGALRFVLAEGAWLLAAFATTVLAGAFLGWLGGPMGAAAPGVALFGLHGLVGVHVALTEGRKLRTWFRPDAQTLAWGLGGGAALLAINVGYGAVLEWAGIVPPDVAALLRGLLPTPALVAWAAIWAPVVEEMYFRGRLLDAFTIHASPAWAALITSAAFALVHGVPEFIPAYLLFAGVLLWLRRRTGGLVAPIVAHMINNAFALLAP